MALEDTSGTKTEEAQEGKYGLHIVLAKDMQPKLRDAVELAYRMGDIPKPDLVDLMNLYISWGMSIQKKKWLDRMGYH